MFQKIHNQQEPLRKSNNLNLSTQQIPVIKL